MAELSGVALDVLARAISGRLQAAPPEEASPSVGAAGVRYQLEVLVHRAGSFGDNLAMTPESILSHAQDEIVRDLEEGRPRAADGTPGARDSGKDLPGTNAAVISGTLRRWYGDARRAALEPSPIPLDGLGAGAQ